MKVVKVINHNKNDTQYSCQLYTQYSYAGWARKVQKLKTTIIFKETNN